jgi:hypothetical protein
MATIRKRESGKWQAIVRRLGHRPTIQDFQHQTSCRHLVQDDSVRYGSVYLARLNGRNNNEPGIATRSVWEGDTPVETLAAGRAQPDTIDQKKTGLDSSLGPDPCCPV